MFFVVDNPRLQRMIQIVREDKKKKLQGPDSPFLRIAAQGNEITVSGDQVFATFPATVYEAGVIFVRTTLFRSLLETFTKEAFLSLQVDASGLHIGNTFVSFEAADMILFPHVEQAPPHWPAKLPEVEVPKKIDPQGKLFDSAEESGQH